MRLNFSHHGQPQPSHIGGQGILRESAMNNALQDLAQCDTVGSLASTLRALCAEFGSLSRLEIMTMTNPGKRQAVCLLHVDSAEQARDLMSKFDAVRFGEDLCIVVDMRIPAGAQD